MSSHMQNYLEGLTALHSADMQVDDTRALGRTVRREAVTTEHPLIRTNPVTGWNGLFFNPGFVTKIVGIPKLESDSIIQYLTEIIATTQEAHVRFQWRENDVAFWDNRSTVSLRNIDKTLYLISNACSESLGFIRLCASSSTCPACCATGGAAILGPVWSISGGRARRAIQFTTCKQGWFPPVQLQ